MAGFDLTPHWDAIATRCTLGVFGALAAMTLVAVVLRVRARTEPARSLAADFGRRTLGWWVILSGFTPAALAGGWILLGLLIAAAVVAWVEFTRLRPDAAFRRVELAWVAVAVAAHFLSAVRRLPAPVLAVDAFVFLAIAATTALAGRGALEARIAWRCLGFVLGVLPFAAAVLLALQYGIGWLIFATVVAQVGDIFQYLFGKRFGRHPLAPTISPKKTWEGFIGGVLSAAALGAWLAPVIDRPHGAGFWWGLVVAIAGSAGGLAMSAAKRRHGVKDFGRWIPGHGGLLDRFDSLGGAAAVVYLALILA